MTIYWSSHDGTAIGGNLRRLGWGHELVAGQNSPFDVLTRLIYSEVEEVHCGHYADKPALIYQSSGQPSHLRN